MNARQRSGITALIQQADRVPGLYNVDIIEHDGTHETFWDLTSGQACDVLRQYGIDPSKVYAVPS